MPSAKRIYTVSQPAMRNMSKGVYTDKKSFYEHIVDIPDVERVDFKDVLAYENKKFNYFNIRKLLTILEVGDSFRLKLHHKNDTVRILEVTVQKTNSPIDIKFQTPK